MARCYRLDNRSVVASFVRLGFLVLSRLGERLFERFVLVFVATCEVEVQDVVQTCCWPEDLFVSLSFLRSVHFRLLNCRLQVQARFRLLLNLFKLPFVSWIGLMQLGLDVVRVVNLVGEALRLADPLCHLKLVVVRLQVPVVELKIADMRLLPDCV